MSTLRRKLSKVEDYPALLNDAYQQMIAPRLPDAPTVISTFAGGGGSSAGYHMAGFRELLAVEWDNNAVETLRLNFPHLDIYHGDIAKLSVDELLSRAGLQPGELDVLDGSPPCQGFSTAGLRDMTDDRNQLFREYIRLLKGLRPKVFVMENVAGMVSGKMKLLFAEILRELKSAGYKVSARLLNTMYFNVPQSRERMIFIGTRDDLGIEPSHPIAESTSISVREAFAGVDDYTDRPLGDTVKKYSMIHPGGWSTEVNRYRQIKGNTADSMSLKWAMWDRCLNTVSKSEISLTGIVHPGGNRYLNLDEVKRCGSFPDQYRFTDRKNGWSRIGNSVPPLFMRSIAAHIRTEVLDKISERSALHTSIQPQLIG